MYYVYIKNKHEIRIKVKEDKIVLSMRKWIESRYLTIYYIASVYLCTRNKSPGNKFLKVKVYLKVYSTSMTGSFVKFNYRIILPCRINLIKC